jgi:acyl-CoA dehydrogenase
VARRVLRGYRPHEGYWPTEYIPAKRDNAWRRMRPVLDARPDPGRAAGEYAARRSVVARMSIAVLCWADA